MATEELPDIHAAYMKYVEQLSTEPTTPTQLINWCQKQQITGVTWSKCSKYFKILNGVNTETKKQHHKTASGPLSLKNNLSAPIPQNATNTIPVPSHPHRRTQSALDSKMHKQNIAKCEKKAWETVMIDTLLSDIKEEETDKATSFKSMFIEQKLKPLSPAQNTALSDNIDKHPLLNKAWNQHKSSTWLQNRMPMSYDLKKWLSDNKFDKFIHKLYSYGIESIDDLKLLNREDIIEDLCGVNHVKMTIIYRRKFIKKVLELNKGNDNCSDENEEKQFKSETETAAVKALTAKIKQTTKSVRITKQIQLEIEENMQSVKRSIIADFDELIKEIALRKAQLLQSIDKKHKNAVNRLQNQCANICQTAMMLLITQQGISQHTRNTEPSAERKQDVIGLIESCFAECSKCTTLDHNVTKANFKYNEGNTASLKHYGQLMFNDEQLL